MGVSSRVLLSHVASEGWQRWHTGVIALPGSETSLRRAAAALLAYSRPQAPRPHPLPLEDQQALIDAVASAARRGQLLWGPSALWLHGLLAEPPEIWVRVPSRSGLVARKGVRLRFGKLPDHLHQLKDMLPVPTVEQGLLEYAASLPDPATAHVPVVDAIAKADSRRMTDLDKLEAHLDAVGAVNGVRTLRRAIAAARGTLSHSRAEARARAVATKVARRYGLSVHGRPMEVFLGTRRVGEADIPVVEINLDIEVDGPHHRMPAQQLADQQRDRLMRRAGWEVERYPVEAVDRVRSFEARVDEAIRARLKSNTST